MSTLFLMLIHVVLSAPEVTLNWREEKGTVGPQSKVIVEKLFQRWLENHGVLVSENELTKKKATLQFRSPHLYFFLEGENGKKASLGRMQLASLVQDPLSTVLLLDETKLSVLRTPPLLPPEPAAPLPTSRWYNKPALWAALGLVVAGTVIVFSLDREAPIYPGSIRVSIDR